MNSFYLKTNIFLIIIKNRQYKEFLQKETLLYIDSQTLHYINRLDNALHTQHRTYRFNISFTHIFIYRNINRFLFICTDKICIQMRSHTYRLFLILNIYNLSRARTLSHYIIFFIYVGYMYRKDIAQKIYQTIATYIFSQKLTKKKTCPAHRSLYYIVI